MWLNTILITVNFKLNRAAKNQNHFNYLWAESERRGDWHTKTHTSVVFHRIASHLFLTLSRIFFFYQRHFHANFLIIQFRILKIFSTSDLAWGIHSICSMSRTELNKIFMQNSNFLTTALTDTLVQYANWMGWYVSFVNIIYERLSG